MSDTAATVGLEANYVWSVLLYQLTLTTVTFWLGVWVCVSDIKVNYTRKLNHFTVFFTPMILALFLPYSSTTTTAAVSAGVFFASTLVFLKPVRDRLPAAETAFASIDRPEDRPHSLLLILSQYAVAFVVLIGLLQLLGAKGRPELISVSFLITAIGDGLAEPFGIRFGRHKYQVPSLFKNADGSQASHTRSWEGSAVVYVSTLLIVLGFWTVGEFDNRQALILSLALPPAMTLAEARSPHTWDTPLMYAVGGLMVWAVL